MPFGSDFLTQHAQCKWGFIGLALPFFNQGLVLISERGAKDGVGGGAGGHRGLFGFRKKNETRTERRLIVVYLVSATSASPHRPPSPTPPQGRPTSESRKGGGEGAGKQPVARETVACWRRLMTATQGGGGVATVLRGVTDLWPPTPCAALSSDRPQSSGVQLPVRTCRPRRRRAGGEVKRKVESRERKKTRNPKVVV